MQPIRSFLLQCSLSPGSPRKPNSIIKVSVRMLLEEDDPGCRGLGALRSGNSPVMTNLEGYGAIVGAISEKASTYLVGIWS